MERGYDGVLPRPPTLEDESYLDYLEAVRNFAIGELFPRLGAQVEAAAASAGLGDGTGASPAAVAAVVDPLPLAGAWRRLMRSQQQLTWRKLDAAYRADAAGVEQRLVAAERERPGRLHYEPGFVVPDYATLDIHLQPGGYVGDPLAGPVFHHGTRVFYQGQNDQDELHRQVVDDVAPPDDGQVARVLDVGCSIGQCTTALKQRWPDATVHGLDVSLPLLRYAHRRAVDLDVDVHFHQGLAEALPFEDGHFDVVLAYILFHEVPARLFAPILAECHRVLRPGGRLTLVDAPNGDRFPLPNRLWMRFDAIHNCEPYSPAFVACDLPGLLRAAGFDAIDTGPTPSFLARTVARRPAA